MVKSEKFRVDTDIRANTNFDKEPLAKDFPIQLNLWYAQNDELTAKFKTTAAELPKENARFRRDCSKARYSYMCNVYFKNVDCLTTFLKKAMTDVEMVQHKVSGFDTVIYPYMLLDKAREIIGQVRGQQRA